MKILDFACTVLVVFNAATAMAMVLPLTSGLAVKPQFNASDFRRPSSLKPRTVWVDGQFEEEWPVHPGVAPHGRPLHFIPYCFANKEAMEKLDHQVWQAVNAWHEALGGDPLQVGDKAGHSLTIQRMSETCYKDDYVDRYNPGTWNIPGFEWAVTIHLAESGASAKPGFTPKEKIVVASEAGRHYMVLPALPTAEDGKPDAPPEELRTFVHEWGHVLGLGHAHQHPDAPVKLRCENIPNMDWVLDFALQKDKFKHYNDDPDGRKKLRDYLCKPENYQEAVFAGCGFTEYITNRPGMKPIGPYDPDSIMHYPTWVHWKDDDGNYHDKVWRSPMPWNPEQATMSRVLPDGSEEPFRENLGLSQGDIKAVKERYPL